MKSRELLIQTIKDELPRFERTLKAVPDDASLDYRPHEKSRTATDLLAVFADEANMLVSLVGTAQFDVAAFTPSTYPSGGAAAAAFSTAMAKALEAIAACDDEKWEGKARFMSGEKVEWETNLGQMAWGFLLDLIHHRGQLSVYIRPLGGRVPSIYGPSADENG